MSNSHTEWQSGGGPRLPLELEREIFEIAALDNAEDAILLSLVAKRIQIWLEPIVYRTSYRNPLARSSPAFSRWISESKRQRVLQYTERLLLRDTYVKEATDIINQCPNIWDLSIWDLRQLSQLDLLLAILPSFSIQRLYIGNECLSWLRLNGSQKFNPSLYLHLTHLSLHVPKRGSPSYKVIASHATIFSKLPCLTHFAVFRSATKWSIIQKLLADCTTLQLLIVFQLQTTAAVHDSEPRVVYLDPWVNTVAGWVQEELDFWQIGEKVRDDQKAIEALQK
ncbi:hypothetical protein CPB83DRAFT_857162 [Crepidotus variabilis]|uniref:Uncharacterized protein n=1 Tax=Crepidotus variabilis TaxID=179855 RepID=A0A9P6JN09_9AGAR|nr:hypothetical protein CPB83DRAFT_857162 [Crepidotus variabilis]